MARLIWLGTLGGVESVATGVSADGSVVVGYALDTRGRARAFRWTEKTGMQDLGSGIAHGVSADGAVVVGVEKGDFYWDSAFRWTAEGGMQDLGMLHGYELASWAYGVSADGAVVVGGAEGLIDWLAFRWTAEGGMQDLDTLGGSSDAHAVSADGSVVVGGADITSGQSRAFRWTAENGMQDLNQLYADLLKNGSYLEIAFAISPDGRYIVGQGYNAATKRKEAFLLDTLGKPSQ